MTSTSDGAKVGRSSFLPLLPLLLIYVVIATTGWNRAPADDEVRYLGFADSLSHGAYVAPGAELWSPPGYPVLLAPFRAIGFGPGALRLLNAPILFAAVWCFFRFLRSYFPDRAALLGAYALGLYFPLWKSLPWLMTEILAVCLVCMLLWAWSEILRRDRVSPGWLAVAAIAFAWLCLTRAIFGYVLLICLIVYLVYTLLARGKLYRRMLMAHALAAVLCLPWLGYTYSKTGKLFYWSTAGGMQLYWMTRAGPGEWGDWRPIDESSADAPARFHHKLDELQRDEAFHAEAFCNLSTQPWAYVRNIAANLSRMFFSFPYSHTPQKLSSLFYALPNSFLLAFAALGLVRLARDERPLRRKPGQAGIESFHPTLLFAWVGLAGTALLAAYARMLFPFVPVLLLLAVRGLEPLLMRPEQAAS